MKLVATVLLAIAIPMQAFAGKMAEPTKEERKKMADMHAQMADCLKSNKAFKDCHKMMEKLHAGMMKDGASCPMMGNHHEGMNHGDMKKGEGMKTEDGKTDSDMQ